MSSSLRGAVLAGVWGARLRPADIKGGEENDNNNKEMDDKNKGVVDNKEDYNTMVAVVTIVDTITIITIINTINTITPRYC